MSLVGSGQNLIPQNAKAIYDFLIKAGFSSNAAAGILGNIFQESGGNPEAGSNPPGKGLIQKLGDPGGTLEHELSVLMAYVRANGSVADINAHSQSASSAALYFSERYERPGTPDNPTRVASAEAVAEVAKSGNWPKSSGITGGGNVALGSGASLNAYTIQPPSSGGVDWNPLTWFSGFGTTLGDIATALSAMSNTAVDTFKLVSHLSQPSFWVRVGAFMFGLLMFGMGITMLVQAMDPNIGPEITGALKSAAGVAAMGAMG